MDKMKLYENALSYHATGKLVAEGDVEDAPFDDAKPAPKARKDEYGNTIKDKNAAKHLAKKGLKKAMSEEEILEILDDLEACYEAAIDLQDTLEEAGIDLEELIAITEESVEEGFSSMSKTKQLIARRKAGRSKKLRSGYAQKNNRHRAKRAVSIQRK